MKKQLSYILGRQQRYIEFSDDMADGEELQEIMPILSYHNDDQ